MATKRKSQLDKNAFGWTQSQLRSAGVVLTRVTAKVALEVTNPKAMVRAMALRDRLLMAISLDDLAISLDDQPAISTVLRALGRAVVDKEILKATGLGHLLGDRSLWRSTGGHDTAFAQTLRQKWKTIRTLSQDEKERIRLLRAPSFAIGFRSSFFC